MVSTRLARTCLVALIATSAPRANAERSVTWVAREARQAVFQGQDKIQRQAEAQEEQAVSQSLKRDVAQHPDEFVVFETREAAERFLRDHMPDSSRETEPAMVARGILGYWRGRTLVVVPPLPSGPIL